MLDLLRGKNTKSTRRGHINTDLMSTECADWAGLRVSEQLIWLSLLWRDGELRYCRLHTVSHTSGKSSTLLLKLPQASTSHELTQLCSALCYSLLTIYRGMAERLAPLSGQFNSLSSSKHPPHWTRPQIQTALVTSQTLDVSHLMPYLFSSKVHVWEGAVATEWL